MSLKIIFRQPLLASAFNPVVDEFFSRARKCNQRLRGATGGLRTRDLLLSLIFKNPPKARFESQPFSTSPGYRPREGSTSLMLGLLYKGCLGDRWWWGSQRLVQRTFALAALPEW